MGTTLFEQPGAERWTTVDADTYEPFYDEDGHPVTYTTQHEAVRSVAEDMVEQWNQVERGERTIEEVGGPDEVHACTVNDDGSVTLENGTHIENRQH